MRRLLPVLLILALPCSFAIAGPSKEFKQHGFKWTLPSSDWQFVPAPADMVRAGFVAKVECTAASVECWAYVKATDGLSLGERVQELQMAGGDGMGMPVKTKVLDTTVSGIKGKVVIQKIKADSGAVGHFRKYAVISDGKFYQLLFRCWHDAHLSVSEEINGVRKGFRLLKGAGDEDEDEEMDEVDGGGSAGGGNGGGDRPPGHPPVRGGGGSGAGGDGGGGVDGDDDDSDWPADAPEKSGRTIRIHNRNIEWTLPSKSPLSWRNGYDAKKKAGIFVTAMGRVEREKQEFEKDTPDHNFCRVDLLIQPAQAGFKPDQWMRGGRAQNEVEENFKLLKDINSAKTRTKDEVKFGNHTAAYIKLQGKDNRSGEDMVLMMFATVLREDLYIVWARCWGYTDAYKQMAPIVGKALTGIKFLETKEPVRGPLLGVLPDTSGQRGKYMGEEKKFTGPGYTFTKPEEMARIEIKGEAGQQVKMCCEGRSEDGEAYLYFEVRYFKLNISNRPNPDPEKFIEKRSQDWLAGAGDKAYLGSRSGLKIKKGSFGTAKGHKYEFTGHLGGEVPFVERGWVVKHKSVLLWIKMQYGGVDAPTKLKKLGKAVMKGMKYK